MNLWHYHRDALHFHDTLDAPHHATSPGRGSGCCWAGRSRSTTRRAGGCGAASCSAEVLLLGTPLLWWSFLPALVGVGGFGIARRDWRAVAIFLGALAGIVPWFRVRALPPHDVLLLRRAGRCRS